MLVSGTTSSQTVCQMPDTAVYQMPFGCRDCLPRSWSSGVAGIPDGHDQLVFPWKDVVRHIKRKGQVAAGMRTDELIVQPEAALIIDRLEMQEQPLA